MDPNNIYANAAAAAAAGQMFIDPSIMATMTANMEGLGGNLAGLAGLGGVGGVGVVPGLEPPRTSLRSADTFQCALRSCDQPPQRKHVINKDTKVGLPCLALRGSFCFYLFCGLLFFPFCPDLQ